MQYIIHLYKWSALLFQVASVIFVYVVLPNMVSCNTLTPKVNEASLFAVIHYYLLFKK